MLLLLFLLPFLLLLLLKLFRAASTAAKAFYGVCTLPGVLVGVDYLLFIPI